jgi:exodeoxyribonuclease VII large subunit
VHPAERLRSYQQLVIQLKARLAFAFSHRVHRCATHVERLQASLAGLDPTAVLARGYSITYRASGELIRDSGRVHDGERITTTLARGRIESEVKKSEDS